MVKRLVPIVAALVLMTSAQLYALSLGELTLQSSQWSAPECTDYPAGHRRACAR
jgi:hypothetical protein